MKKNVTKSLKNVRYICASVVNIIHYIYFQVKTTELEIKIGTI